MKPHLRPHGRPDRSHFEDEELYLVAAALICGMAPSRIATALGKKSQIVIGRMLQKAYSAGILRLNFLPRRVLEQVLHEASAGSKFHVVPDYFRPFPHGEAQIIGLDPVCIAAADVVRKRIEHLLSEKKHGPIRVGCTGGYSLSKTVEALAGDLLHNEARGAERLEFVALNAAMPINNYHISSNHLVTRLSLLYSDGVRIARHLAVMENSGKKLQQQYERAVKDLDLVLVSGGSVRGSYLSDYLGEKGIALPSDAIGDLGYCLLRADGTPAECSDEAAAAIQELRSALGYDDLRNFAKQGNLIVVLSEHRNVLWAEEHREKDQFRPSHVTKLPLALALMQVKLASEIVIGQSLAQQIVRELELTLPEPKLGEIREQLREMRDTPLHGEFQAAIDS
jgi:hypothetical protein